MVAPSTPSPAIHWFRDDLRLGDNPALTAAVESGRPVLCVYVHDQASEGIRPLGGAAKWWLAGSLRALRDSLGARGTDLHIVTGRADQAIAALAAASGAALVTWTRRYGEAERRLDAGIKATLEASGIAVRSLNGHLLNEPWEVMSKAGGPMKVFTPYWRAARLRGPPAAALPAPGRIAAAAWPAGVPFEPLPVEALGFEPSAPDWAGGLRAEWRPGEAGAAERLADFLDGGLTGYAEGRNRPDLPSTSRLSPHLRFGEISVRQCWHAAEQAVLSGASRGSSRDLGVFQSELGWREFSHHLLFHNPDLAVRNLDARFDVFPWRSDPAALRAWQAGMTGYPLVDAGMRELWATGWMHNRVRMLAASFLIKHLLIDWRSGEDWFWDTLVDADPANNAANWQWVAGSGADAAPYHRIFNPVLQGERFDPDGSYVRRWVPEIARLPAPLIHQPWTAPPDVLEAAGIRLGRSYPERLVDHGAARQRALAAFATIRSGSGDS